MSIVITRRHSKKIHLGNVAVGGDAPISVQSMTNTNTCDVAATVAQVNALTHAGADIVRVSVPDMESVKAFAAIKKQVTVPLVADIHFDYKIALAVAPYADCLRINPGNIGKKNRVRAVIDAANTHGIPIRIGVNAGSIEKDLQVKYKEPVAEALVESALRQIALLDECQFSYFKVSLKASDVLMAVEAYQLIAKQVDNPLHLGITEAGVMRSGSVKSALGIGSLLMAGIGDTIRVSLAEDPVQEVKVGWDILKSLHLRTRGVNLIACPSCSRQNFDVIATANALEAELEDIQDPIDVAVIGCMVNGPGEAKHAQLGLTGGTPNHLLYVDGAIAEKIAPDNLVAYLAAQVRTSLAKKRSLITTKTL